jgi:leishmanolysin
MTLYSRCSLKMRTFGLIVAIVGLAMCSRAVTAHGGQTTVHHPPQPSHSPHRQSAEVHECIHDSGTLQASTRSLLAAKPSPQRYHVDDLHREMSVMELGSIRIAFSFDNLGLSGSYCSVVGDVVPDYMGQGATTTCDTQHDVLTSQKRDVIRSMILPRAASRIAAHVSLARVAGNLVVPSRTVCGPEFVVPSPHTITGVADADLIVYVASGPIGGNTVAFAGACALDQYGRAVVGRINFDTERLQWTGDPVHDDGLVDVAVHELTHVLGISATSLSDPLRTKTVERRGKTVRVVTSPNVVMAVRQFTGCAELDGAEVEDEGTSGSAGSHWERKLYKDDLMCAVVGSRMSILTLAFLNDLSVGYEIDLSVSENMLWGRATGCGVHFNRCDTSLGGRDNYFCFDDPSGGSLPSRCTATLDAIGTCAVFEYQTDLAPQFQYFSNPRLGGPSYMDGCPIVTSYSNRQCTATRASNDNELVFGYTFSPMSRCFDTRGVIQDGYSSTSTDGPRCLEATCVGSALQFRVGGSEYVTCPASDAVVSVPTGFSGEVICPDIEDMCASINLPLSTPAPPDEPPNFTVVSPPFTSAPTAYPASPGIASPSYYEPGGPNQVRGSMTVIGTAFSQLHEIPSGWQDLQNALQLDVAALVGIDPRSVSVMSMQLGERSLNVDFSVGVSEGRVSGVAGRIRGFRNAYDPLPRSTIVYRRVAPDTEVLRISVSTASGVTPLGGALVALIASLLLALGGW